MLNPFTVTACKISGLNGANSIFSGPVTAIFNAVRFDETPFTCQYEKEDKKTEGFQISHFYGSFSSDIMAVKGLTSTETVRLIRDGEKGGKGVRR